MTTNNIEREKFGWVRVWFKGNYKDVELDEGILCSGRINVTEEYRESLINYLSNPGNAGTYGHEIDIVLFVDDGGAVKGNISRIISSDEGDTKSKKTSTVTAKRKL